jgi:hypothetical protein
VSINTFSSNDHKEKWFSTSFSPGISMWAHVTFAGIVRFPVRTLYHAAAMLESCTVTVSETEMMISLLLYVIFER